MDFETRSFPSAVEWILSTTSRVDGWAQ